MKLLDYWSNLANQRLSGTGLCASPPLLGWTAAEVFYDYAPRVYNLARRMLRNVEDAEDVTQDVLLQVVRKLNTFRGEAKFPTWLHRVTVNASMAHRRRQARRHEHQVEAGPDNFPVASLRLKTRPDRQVVDKETRQLIERAIARLPKKYRHVLLLAEIDGLPTARIGQLLGLRIPAVKSRLHRARLMVRNLLRPHFPEACP